MLHLMCTLQTLGVRGADLLKQRKDDRGQTAAEYVGIIVIVGAIIAVIVAADIPTTVTTNLTSAITKIFSGGGAAG